jgi:nitrite reductase (NADH) small subunit
MKMRHPVGPVESFPEGTFRIVSVGGHSLGILRRGEDFYGVLNVCPHRAAPICMGAVTGTMLPSPPGEFVYGLDGLVLRCPWHGWEFDVRDGASIGPTDKRGLTVYEVLVEDGTVVVELGSRSDRQATSAVGAAASAGTQTDG